MVSPVQGPFEFLQLKFAKSLNRHRLDNGIPVFSVSVHISIRVLRFYRIKAFAGNFFGTSRIISFSDLPGR
jgi:hypothetical protein